MALLTLDEPSLIPPPAFVREVLQNAQPLSNTTMMIGAVRLEGGGCVKPVTRITITNVRFLILFFWDQNLKKGLL